MQRFIDQFSDIVAPRVERTKKHKLTDILFITMAAIICGCHKWEQIEAYAQQNERWPRNYIELTNDTINRVIYAIDPKAMQACFVQWCKALPICWPWLDLSDCIITIDAMGCQAER